MGGGGGIWRCGSDLLRSDVVVSEVSLMGDHVQQGQGGGEGRKKSGKGGNFGEAARGLEAGKEAVRVIDGNLPGRSAC